MKCFTLSYRDFVELSRTAKQEGREPVLKQYRVFCYTRPLLDPKHGTQTLTDRDFYA